MKCIHTSIVALSLVAGSAFFKAEDKAAFVKAIKELPLRLASLGTFPKGQARRFIEHN